MITSEQLIKIVTNDQYLSPTEKNELLQKLHEPSFAQNLLHGSIGAGISLAFTKYMKMSKTAQILLSMAGFGIGRYLLDASRKYDKFIQFNSKTKAYDIIS